RLRRTGAGVVEQPVAIEVAGDQCRGAGLIERVVALDTTEATVAKAREEQGPVRARWSARIVGREHVDRSVPVEVAADEAFAGCVGPARVADWSSEGAVTGADVDIERAGAGLGGRRG